MNLRFQSLPKNIFISSSYCQRLISCSLHRLFRDRVEQLFSTFHRPWSPTETVQQPWLHSIETVVNICWRMYIKKTLFRHSTAAKDLLVVTVQNHWLEQLSVSDCQIGMKTNCNKNCVAIRSNKYLNQISHFLAIQMKVKDSTCFKQVFTKYSLCFH